MPANQITPGLMLVHGNHPESLREVLVSWMARLPLMPLEDEVILVQSNGIAQWLKMALARDVADGGSGIAAAIDAQLPSSFLWRAYRLVLGADAVPQTSPFDKAQLVWRLMRLLPALVNDPASAPVFAPLSRFLAQDTDQRRLYQLAQRLADLLDQYQVYRADWLADWARGEDVIQTSRRGAEALPDGLRWQPQLWRALLEDVAADMSAGDAAHTSRADVHNRFLAAAQNLPEGERPKGLPRRLMVFGISSLPQQSLEVLAALSRWMQVLMCVHNPCEHYWANIVADKDLLRAQQSRQTRKSGMPEEIPDEEMHLHANPLLAAWGKQGRDFIGLLDAHDDRERYEQRFADLQQRIDLFEANGDDTLLHQLQDDIRELRPLAETQQKWPAVDVAADSSVRFHVAHSPQREVEVLHDQLLAAFAADATLRPRDVIVMVPDIDTYAPHVQAVFGMLEPHDRRHIRFTIADRSQRHNDPLVNAVETLLSLPQLRVAVSDVLDLIEVPAVSRRFGIDEQQVPLLQRWIAAANVRWGLHAEQRRSLGLADATDQNSWLFGMRRMLLGYAVGHGEAWNGIEPMDEIGGLDAELLGPLGALLQSLDDTWRALREPASPDVWCTRLRAMLAAFFDAGDGKGSSKGGSSDDGADGFTLHKLDNALQAWQDACAAARLVDELPLSVVREHWLSQMEPSGLSQPFFAGAVTFATLMPMRSIPFRHVCLLGMNDGDYPRSRPPMDFDLMGRDYRPGDRSRREDDRYLFLEALLAAREHLHVSWVGRSINDNSDRPPSVLVAQLRDHIAAGWTLAGEGEGEGGGGKALVHALTVEHRLQPFSRDYFTGEGSLFSFAHEWREGLLAAARDEAPVSSADELLEPMQRDTPLALRDLSEFLANPVRAFFRQRLGVYFELADTSSEDQEPFAVDALQNWKLQDELIAVQRQAVEAGESREDALSLQMQRIARRGELPQGEFAHIAGERLAEPMADLFARFAQAGADWPNLLPDEDIDLQHLTAQGPLQLADTLRHLRSNENGEKARLLLVSDSLIKDRSYRLDKIIPYWVGHLAAHVAGMPLHTVIVSKTGTIALPAMDIGVAQEHWAQLLDGWVEGMRRPLPLAVNTGFAWLKKSSSNTEDALHAAREAYEPSSGFNEGRGELGRSVYLQRAWPSFDALWADGEFATWAERLLRPVLWGMPEATRSQGKGSKAAST